MSQLLTVRRVPLKHLQIFESIFSDYFLIASSYLELLTHLIPKLRGILACANNAKLFRPKKGLEMQTLGPLYSFDHFSPLTFIAGETLIVP